MNFFWQNPAGTLLDSNPRAANPYVAVAPTTAGGREIVDDGLVLLREIEQYQTGKKGQWFIVAEPGASGKVLMLRQSPSKWHSFFEYEGTASGGRGPRSGLSGGLGDAIDTDAQLRGYCRLVSRGPGYRSYHEQFQGLSASQSQCYGEYGE